MNDPESDEDEFSKEERITANLRLRSVSPTGRTLLGFFAFVPPVWRGPLAIVVVILLAYLALSFGPGTVKWIQSLNL